MAPPRKKIRKVALLSNPDPILLVAYLPDEPEVLKKLYEYIEKELESQSKLTPKVKTYDGPTARQLKKKGFRFS